MTDPMRERFGDPWPPVAAMRLDVAIDAEAPWSDLDPKALTHGFIERVAFLRNATRHGNGGILVLIRLDDGRLVVAETTYRLAHAAARAIGASPHTADEDV